MLLSGLTFAKGRGAARLGFSSHAQRALSWGTVGVQTVLVGMSAILFAKGFLVDYPSSSSFLDPGTLMTLQSAGVISLAAFFYWLLSSVHLRVTSRSHWQADALYGAGVLGVAAALFAFGYTHGLTEVYAKYLYIELAWFLLALLGVSIVPWLSGTWYVVQWSRPLLLFAATGVLWRGILLTLLVIGRLYFQGTKIYDGSVTDDILAHVGFTNATQGFVTILWIALLLLAFAASIGVLVVSTLGADAFFRATPRVSRSLLPGAFVSAVIAMGYTVKTVVVVNSAPLVWIVFAVATGIATLFLALNVLLRIKGMPDVLRTLAISLQLLVVITASFALQYFLDGTDGERAAAFMVTVPAVLFTAIHMTGTGVAKGSMAQRPLTMVLSSLASAAVSYAFLTTNGFADLLPREVPVKTMFNFILIGAVLFGAVYACGRLLLATNAATRLLALRAAGA